MRVLRGVVYMTKSSGPRTEPWGTPQEEVCQEDNNNAFETVGPEKKPCVCHLDVRCKSIVTLALS